MHKPCRKHNLPRNSYGQCKQCVKEWRSSEVGKKFIKESWIKWLNKKDGRLQYNAVQRVHKAIKRGALIRKPCIVCNNPKSEAHHAWGYSEEYALHVVFLCKRHHIYAGKDASFNETIKSDYLQDQSSL